MSGHKRAHFISRLFGVPGFGPAIIILLAIHVIWPQLAGMGEISYDGAQYLRYAENLLNTGRFTYDGINPSCGRSPGYPAFLAVFLSCTDNLTYVYSIQLIFLFLTYLAVASMIGPTLPPRWRFGLILVLSAMRPLTGLAMVIQTEVLFFFLASFALLFLSRFLQHGKLRHLLFFIALSTCSAYVRPVTMPFVFFAGIVLWLTRRCNWRSTVLMIVLSAAMLAPWTYRNWTTFHKFVPLASNYGSVYYMTDPEAFKTIMLWGSTASHSLPVYHDIVKDDFELDLTANEEYLRRAKMNIKQDPVGFIKRCILKTVFVWSYLPSTRKLLTTNRPLFFVAVLLQWSFLCSAAVTIFHLRRTHSSIILPGALFAVYHVIALFPFYAESRFLISVYLIFCGYSTYTAYDLYSRWRLRHRTAKL